MKLVELGVPFEHLQAGEIIELELYKPRMGKKQDAYAKAEVDAVLEAYAADLSSVINEKEMVEAELEQKNKQLEEQGEQLVAYQQNDAKLQNFSNMMSNLENAMAEVQQAKIQDNARIAQLQTSLETADKALDDARSRAEQLQQSLTTAEGNLRASNAQLEAVEKARKQLDDTVANIEDQVNSILASLESELADAGLV